MALMRSMKDSCDIHTVLSFKLLEYVSTCLNPLSPPPWFYATGFFVRRSHACHDRLLITTATLFSLQNRRRQLAL
ncbi:unnamed protein product [Rhodiola kirilowii]